MRAGYVTGARDLHEQVRRGCAKGRARHEPGLHAVTARAINCRRSGSFQRFHCGQHPQHFIVFAIGLRIPQILGAFHDDFVRRGVCVQ